MPRLVSPEMLRQIAIFYLLELYKQETGFVTEWKRLRQLFSSPLRQLAKIWALSWFSETVGTRFYNLFEAERDYQRLENYLEGFPPSLTNPRDRHELAAEYEEILERLEPYTRALNDLAYRWNLRAPWAADELLSDDVDDVAGEIFKAAGVAIPVEDIPSCAQFILPFLSPLEVELPWWSFVTQGRQRILAAISKKLAVYEAMLKAKGAQEFPSSLEAHARWWFQHHVRHKTYDEIAQLEVYTAGGKLVSYAKNVGAAVRKFSRLIGINPQNLK